MANHPNRSTWRSELPAPTPADIRAAREAAGLTQPAAAELAGLSNYQRWAEYESGARRPSAALWELWLLRTGRHPLYTLVERLAVRGRRSPDGNTLLTGDNARS